MPLDSKQLVDPTILFRFEVRLLKQDLEWTSRGLSLPEACRLPSFAALSGGPIYADLRLAWSTEGMGFSVKVSGKRAMPWCRDTRLDESDGLHLWIDTRNSPNIHRATQHCHRFLWLPAGGGPQRDRPVAQLVPINRARGNPKSIGNGALKIHAAPKHDGYEMSGLIPSAAMTGFDPVDQPRIGFYYAVADRELGYQSLTLSEQFPVAEDPSLWGEAALISA
ncbi:hypothetical protein CA85_18680 [Allorhodopirellula solitaria]|uniref:Carbohydrate-binding domain-containing protein n=1 Tax=Allorhodopirellula solitaria TaxID=2527987 RepID=A0A5C5YEI0_9BACT|nr:hypothetical protein [Allorhodopirellula solitaria]TWT73398.1 hypothetical protein CA85_18680 [Allorhodopirellula solitaria]